MGERRGFPAAGQTVLKLSFRFEFGWCSVRTKSGVASFYLLSTIIPARPCGHWPGGFVQNLGKLGEEVYWQHDSSMTADTQSRQIVITILIAMRIRINLIHHGFEVRSSVLLLNRNQSFSLLLFIPLQGQSLLLQVLTSNLHIQDEYRTYHEPSSCQEDIDRDWVAVEGSVCQCVQRVLTEVHQAGYANNSPIHAPKCCKAEHLGGVVPSRSQPTKINRRQRSTYDMAE